MFRVIIAGGRGFNDYQLLKATMDKLLCNITDDITVCYKYYGEHCVCLLHANNFAKISIFMLTFC